MSIFLIVCCSCLSCKSAKEINIKKQYIEVIFFKGFVETTRPIKCGTLIDKPSLNLKDTLISNNEKFVDIVNQVKLLKASIEKNRPSNCDIRLQCKINYGNGDSLKLCIGEFNCIIENGQIMEKNDTLVYLIRKYSGYYNYFPKQDLNSFDELKQFGIPEDYIDLRRPKNLDGTPLPPQ